MSSPASFYEGGGAVLGARNPLEGTVQSVKLGDVKAEPTVVLLDKP